MTKFKAIFLWLAIANTNLLFAQQNNLAIRNNALSATFNPAQKTFEVKDIATGIIFLRKGIAKDVAKAVSVSVTDPVFGKGQAIQLMKPDGGNYIMALYPQVPFLFIRETIANRGQETLELKKVSSCSFQVDLQKPVAGMKTLGTGGLHTPNDNPGSYVFLTTVWPQTREGVVTGWLTNERGSGVVFSDTSDSRVSIRPQIDYGRLLVQAGAQTPLETLLVGYFKDARLGEEEYAATIARHQHIQLPPRQAVYCTWYSEKNGGAGNEKSTDELTNFIVKSLKPFGLGVVQIDDEWQDGGKFNGPRRGFDRVKPDGPYPNGMTPTANIIKQNGLTAGIWWMPFSRNHQDPEYKDRQSWFARRTNGSPYETNWGGTSLDLTNPQVQQHLVQTAKTMHGWGFNYFKMDGLWTGTVTEQVYINDGYKDDHIGNSKPLYDSSKTQIEAFRMGLKLLRNNVGKDVFFSGCCISQNMRSFGASIGLVNSMRVGPDYNHDGQTIRTGPLRASRLYFLNGRVWWNDPDPSIIRQSGTATADGACKGIGSLTRARLMPSWVALTGQFFLSSDWLPNLPEERLDIMKRCMLSHNGTARPVDAFDRTLPATWLATDKHTNVERNVIGLFNWDTTKQQIGCGTAWAGLKNNTAYHAFDFWENKVLPDIAKEFAFELPGESCKIIAVRAKANHPVLVSTSKHITQGMVDVKEETWSNATLSGKSELVGGDPYEMRIAGLADNGIWTPENVDVTGLEGATIKILPVTEKGWVRIVIQSEKSGIAQWRIKFRNKV